MNINNISNSNSPFDLYNQSEYERWRDEKLFNYPDKAEQLIVEINDPMNLSNAERSAIIERCNKANMAIYMSQSTDDPDKRLASKLAKQLSLKTLDNNMGSDDDGITSLQVSKSQGRERYIPYSNKAINWHTDGYYNTLDKQIHALNLHCVRPAKCGGENAVMDHEIAYIRLRDKNPEFIHALMAQDSMIIPPNIKGRDVIRPARKGPVFSFTNDFLHMRYTARAHYVIWKKDALTQAAVKALEVILHSNDPAIFRLTLKSGWGLVSNNVLHDRSEFEDDENASRLLYRLRYYERLSRF